MTDRNDMERYGAIRFEEAVQCLAANELANYGDHSNLFSVLILLQLGCLPGKRNLAKERETSKR